MASPLPSAKQPVRLGAAAADSKYGRGSRIRRDPPPLAKADPLIDRDERDRRTVAIGIITFTLAIVVVLLAVASYSGWSPRDYIARL